MGFSHTYQACSPSFKQRVRDFATSHLPPQTFPAAGIGRAGGGMERKPGSSEKFVLRLSSGGTPLEFGPIFWGDERSGGAAILNPQSPNHLRASGALPERQRIAAVQGRFARIASATIRMPKALGLLGFFPALELQRSGDDSNSYS